MQYGIAIKNVSVRTEPTEEPLRKQPGDIWDRRQESRLNIGEAVQIKSFGKNWLYVIAEATAGYALEEGFVLCSKAQYECYKIQCKRECQTVLKAGRNEYGQYLRTGTVLPTKRGLEALGPELMERIKERVGAEYRSRCYRGRYTWEVPPVLIQGSLPLSERQMLLQMERMLGIPYSWGDERVDGMDCSSTIQAFYACFGIRLPRNSSEQKEYGERMTTAGLAEFVDLQGKSAEEKLDALRRLGVGAVLHMPGHVMLYAGQRDGVPLIFHNCDTYTEEEEEFVVRKCVVSEFFPKGEETYLEYLTGAWKLR